MNRYTYTTYPWDRISQIEDPVSGQNMERVLFFEMYMPVLMSLDGNDMVSYIDFWLERSPVDTSILRFIDDMGRHDWIQYAIEQDCIPTMKELCAGENIKDKIKRERVSPKIIKPKNVQKKINNILKCIKDIENTIKTDPDPKLIEKRDRAYLMLNKLTDVTY